MAKAAAAPKTCHLLQPLEPQNQDDLLGLSIIEGLSPRQGISVPGLDPDSRGWSACERSRQGNAASEQIHQGAPDPYMVGSGRWHIGWAKRVEEARGIDGRGVEAGGGRGVPVVDPGGGHAGGRAEEEDRRGREERGR